MKLKLIIAIIIIIALVIPLLAFFTPLECVNDTGECYETTILRVIDGDTIKTADNTSIRFALVGTPELNQPGGIEAKEYIESLCPVGSKIIIDEDDKQLKGSYNRVIAKVTCNGINLNESLVENNHGTIDTRYCNSEFAVEPWASDCK